MSSQPETIHDSLQFAADLVEKIKFGSHSTERNAQQCLATWSRCQHILDALNELISAGADGDWLDAVPTFDM